MTAAKKISGESKRERSNLMLFAQWLIEARRRNQLSAFAVFRLLTENPRHAADKKASSSAQKLVGTTFALWRAAFLADRIAPKRSEIWTDATSFLQTMIEDNAIMFHTEKGVKFWVFNFYIRSAEKLISAIWPDVDGLLDAKYIATKGTSDASRKRWDRCQGALELAITKFEGELAAIVPKPPKKSLKAAQRSSRKS